MADTDSPQILKKLISPYLIFFILMMIGLWLFCWAAWGGSITFNENSGGPEAGLGLNPPPMQKIE